MLENLAASLGFLLGGFGLGVVVLIVMAAIGLLVEPISEGLYAFVGAIAVIGSGFLFLAGFVKALSLFIAALSGGQ